MVTSMPTPDLAVVAPATGPQAAQRHRVQLGRLTPGPLILCVIVAFLVLVPILYLLEGTFVRDGRVTLEFVRQAYSTQGLGTMIFNSIVFALGSSVFALVIGTALAYLVARTDVPFQPLVYAAALLPMVVPVILYTISWMFLLSPQIGAINKVAEPVFCPGCSMCSRCPGWCSSRVCTRLPCVSVVVGRV
jgi:iron(III) transport system permease protein